MHLYDKQNIKGQLQIFTRKVDTEDWVLKVDKKNMVFNTGLNIIRNLVAGTDTTYPTYCAVGSGVTAILATDTYLEEEVWRNTFTSTDVSVSKKVTYETFFSSVQANGNDYISNAGLFTSAPVLIEDGEAVADWTNTNDCSAVTADTTIYQNGSKSMKMALTFAAGNGEVTKTTAIGDISDITGVTSGTPTQGRLRLLVYCDNVANLNGTNAIQYKIGSSAGDYALYSLDDSELVDNTWYLWDIDLSAGAITGTPDWTAVDYNQTIVNCTGNVNVYIDDIQTFGPTIFNAQIFTEFTKDKTTEMLIFWTLEFLDN